MKSLRPHVRRIAAFFIIQIVISVVYPTVSWALTSGPATPEATSFEPVDTTDMVNTLTGDLVYNVPLLEIPGPSGGYPLSLSYHGGIMTDEDASWVGLGWSLNPGAINRSVQGWADDHKNVEVKNNFYWEGGETHEMKAGVGATIGNIGASSGISLGHDTYQGFGVGGYVSLSATLMETGSKEDGNLGGLGAGISVGVNPWGSPYASAGFNFGAPTSKGSSMKIGGGVGVSTNFKSVSGYANGGLSVDYEQEKPTFLDKGSRSLVSASISSSSKGIVPSAGVGGASVSNGKTGSVSTYSFGFSLPIPFVNLGYNYSRYWIDKTDYFDTYGSLYYPTQVQSDLTYYDENAFDTYHLHDPHLEGGIVENEDPGKVAGGSFPDVDSYSVNAQGVTGSMRPYLFTRYLQRQHRKEKIDGKWVYKIRNNQLGADAQRVEFRMLGEFSNRHTYNDPDLVALNTSDRTMSYGFDGQRKTGETGNDHFNGSRLAGTQHIEYWTNKEIGDYTKYLSGTGGLTTAVQRALDIGLIENKSLGFNRQVAPSSQIGGFVITNSSGVRYHFTLPAYSHSELQYSTNIKKTNGHTGSTTWKNEKYAYTWHLTAVTGPDFVDRGAIGQLDDEDWGYWVKFDYGLYVKDYGWRSPNIDLKSDIDRSFNNVSEGKKEIYYLNTIRTKTHTAIFSKSIRNDGKGNNLSKVLGTGGKYKGIGGGFFYKDWSYDPNMVFNFELMEYVQDGWIVNYPDISMNSLKLDRILLIQNEQMSQINIDSLSAINPEEMFHSSDPSGVNYSYKAHYSENVLEDNELSLIPNLGELVHREIRFGTDYSLRGGTSNSYVQNYSGTTPSLTGSLTLKDLKFYGHGGASLPAMKFHYDVEDELSTGQLKNQWGKSKLEVGELKYEWGDILALNTNSYYLIQEVDTANQEYILKHIDGPWILVIPGQNMEVTYRQTKNPPFTDEMNDLWGFYKSDFSSSLTELNENLGRQTSPISAKSMDVWSLRRVTASLGAEIHIEYEPDSYSNVVLQLKKPFMIQNSTNPNLSNNTIDLEISYPLDPQVISQSDYFLGEHIKVDAAVSWKSLVNETGHKSVQQFDGVVNNVNGNILTVQLPGLVDVLKSDGLKNGTFEVEGNLYIPELETPYPQYGGGIRCSAIKLTNKLTGVSSITRYEIKDELGLTSGSTPYTPEGMDLYSLDFINDNGNENIGQSKQAKVTEEFKKLLYVTFDTLMSNSRELPPPGVMYSRVAVKEFTVQMDGTEYEHPQYSVYHFETFSKTMVNLIQPILGQSGYDSLDFNGIQVINDTTSQWAIKRAIRRNVTLENRTGQLGSLKKIELHTKDGVLNETINHYLHDEPNYEARLEGDFSNQGLIEEQFVESRIVRLGSEMTVIENGLYKNRRAHELYGVVSKRVEYPVVNLGTTTINYKTGIKTATRNLAFDFYSGEVTTTYAEDGYGNKLVSHSVPAYRLKNSVGLAAYSGMGLVMDGGANMLTQEGAIYSYLVDESFDASSSVDFRPHIVGVVSASLQTWSDKNEVMDGPNVAYTVANPDGIYRKKANYAFIGDTNPQYLTAGGVFDSQYFSEATLESDNTIASNLWQKNAEITLYDVNSHALEATDINGNYAATRLDEKNERVISTVANARFGEFTASGFESANEGDVLVSGTLTDGIGTPLTKSHSGGKMVKTTGAQTACSYTGNSHSSRKYKVSFWSSSPTVQVVLAGNHTPKVVGTYGSWYLMESLVDVSAGNFTAQVKSLATGTTDVYFDDFRMHPIDATMTSYVYNTWGELSDILDANNLFTHYEYDGMGRLKSVKRETLKYGPVKTSEIDIRYARTE